jgi:hypothetical protein
LTEYLTFQADYPRSYARYHVNLTLMVFILHGEGSKREQILKAQVRMLTDPPRKPDVQSEAVEKGSKPCSSAGKLSKLSPTPGTASTTHGMRWKAFVGLNMLRWRDGSEQHCAQWLKT